MRRVPRRRVHSLDWIFQEAKVPAQPLINRDKMLYLMHHLNQLHANPILPTYDDEDFHVYHASVVSGLIPPNQLDILPETIYFWAWGVSAFVGQLNLLYDSFRLEHVEINITRDDDPILPCMMQLLPPMTNDDLDNLVPLFGDTNVCTASLQTSLRPVGSSLSIEMTYGGARSAKHATAANRLAFLAEIQRYLTVYVPHRLNGERITITVGWGLHRKV